MITEPEPIHTDLWHRDGEEIHILQDQVASTQVGAELDAKGLLLRDALAIVTVVGALVAFYGMIKLVSYLAESRRLRVSETDRTPPGGRIHPVAPGVARTGDAPPPTTASASAQSLGPTGPPARTVGIAGVLFHGVGGRCRSEFRPGSAVGSYRRESVPQPLPPRPPGQTKSAARRRCRPRRG